MKKIFIILSVFLFQFCFACDLDFKIGQMIIAGFDGNTIKSRGFKKTLKQIKNGEISGVIYFSKNIKSKNDLTEMNKMFLEANPIIPFISIDNEGGKIQRYDFFQHKSAKEVSNLDLNEAKKEYSNMSNLEKELGFNLNFAPCVDLEINKNSIISIK